MNFARALFSGLLIAVIAPAALEAQTITPFSIEGRVSAGIPTGDFGDGIEAGVGFGAGAAYRVVPMLDIYAGYSWTRFGLDDDPEFDDLDLDITDSGFAVGARLHVPTLTGLDPWLQAGLLLHQLKFSGSEGGVSASVTSDRGIGFEVGGGLSVPLAPSISFVPAVRYRQYSAEFEMGEDLGGAGDVKYVGVDVGLRFRF